MRVRTGVWGAVIACGLLCLALPTFAQDTVYFDGVVGGNDTGTTGTQTSEDAYTGLYSGTLNGTAVSGFICDDYFHTITSPETWQATAVQASTLGSNNNINNVEFGGTIGLTGYAEVAMLVSAMYTIPSTGNTSTASLFGLNVNVTDLSEAIWAITSGGASKIQGTSGLSANALALIGDVMSYFANSANLSPQAWLAKYGGNLWILTPTSGQGGSNGPPQEFWANIATPEGGAPLMYLLLAGCSCFGGMFFSSRSKLRNRGTA